MVSSKNLETRMYKQMVVFFSLVWKLLILLPVCEIQNSTDQSEDYLIVRQKRDFIVSSFSAILVWVLKLFTRKDETRWV